LKGSDPGRKLEAGWRVSQRLVRRRRWLVSGSEIAGSNSDGDCRQDRCEQISNTNWSLVSHWRGIVKGKAHRINVSRRNRALL